MSKKIIIPPRVPIEFTTEIKKHKISKDFETTVNELIVNEIIYCIKNNTTMEEAHYIFNNNIYNDFIKINENNIFQPKFNQDYYNKWKLKRKLNDF